MKSKYVYICQKLVICLFHTFRSLKMRYNVGTNCTTEVADITEHFLPRLIVPMMVKGNY